MVPVEGHGLALRQAQRALLEGTYLALRQAQRAFFVPEPVALCVLSLSKGADRRFERRHPELVEGLSAHL